MIIVGVMRSLSGMAAAVIVLIAAVFMPVIAEAHPGHHKPALALSIDRGTLATTSAVQDIDSASDHADDAAMATVLTAADDRDPRTTVPCAAPCCCVPGGVGCASSILGLASSATGQPDFARPLFELMRVDSLQDALGQRRPKPPRA